MVRTNEDELWMEMHYAAGQLNMYHIRGAFTQAGYRLLPLPPDVTLTDVPVQHRLEEIIDRLVGMVGGSGQDDWDRFVLACFQKGVGPVDNPEVPTTEQKSLWPVGDMARAYNTTPEEILLPKPEAHPDGVLFWSNAGDPDDSGWDRLAIKPPAYAHEGDAGLDLACIEGAVLEKGEVADIPLGVSLQPPPGTWYLLHGRSSAINKGLHVFTGVIDFGYRGPLFARVMALEHTDVVVGDRLVQAVLFPLTRAERVVYAAKLADHVRGEDGFGSTGT